MTRFVLLATLLACACSAAPEADGAPTYSVRAAPAYTLWLEPGALGYAEQAQWGLPLPADFHVDLVTHEVCGSPSFGGCANGSHIEMRDTALAQGPEAFSAYLLHELGHVYGAAHIDDAEACPVGAAGRFVMCAWGPGPLKVTTEDFNQLPGASTVPSL